MSDETQVTQLLQRYGGGDEKAERALFAQVYDELRRIAGGYMRKEREGHTLQTTGLVHEAYLRLIGQTRISWQNRAHFYGVAAQVMRRILVDYARGRNAGKRGGGKVPLPLDPNLVFTPRRSAELISLDEALDNLEKLDREVWTVIHLRFFAGLSVVETAKAVELSPRTVRRRWEFGRAWLATEMRADPRTRAVGAGAGDPSES